MPRGVHRQVLCAALIWSLGCGAATTTAAPGTPEPVARAASAAPVGDPMPVAPVAQSSSTPVADAPSSTATPVAGSAEPPANPWFPDYHPQPYQPCRATDRAGLLACLDAPGVAGTEVKGKLVAMVFADSRSPSPLGLELVQRGVISDGLRVQLQTARVSVRKELTKKGAPFASASLGDFTVAYRPDESTFRWSKRSSKRIECNFVVDVATFRVSDDAVSEVVTSFDAEPDPGCCIFR